MVLWDVRLPSSWSAGFLNKVTIPRPSNSFLDLLACSVVSSMTLDSNKFWRSQPGALLLVASQPWLGNFGVRP